MTVLIVDDEPAVAELFQAALESRGHACLVAASLEEATWTVTMARVDAIALDLALPGGDSVAWLEALAGARPGLATRTTIVSGRLLTEAEEVRVRTCGARFLLKPVSVATLVDTLADDRSPLRGRAKRIDSSTRI